MLNHNEYLAFLRFVQTQRRTTRQSFLLALLYASQVLIAGAILLFGYAYFQAPGVMWALVSAILVIQPGVQQSIAASAVRIAANIVGGSIAFTIGYFAGTGIPQLLAALAVVVLVCELLRLDLGLRTACVAAIIVLTANEGHVSTSAAERLAAVLIGCALAVLLQLLVELFRKIFKIPNAAALLGQPSAASRPPPE